MPVYSDEVRRWYGRAQWRNLRTLVLARDPVCRICQRNASTIADHIVPHKGVWELFCDITNLQGLCAACHSKKTAEEDGGFGNVRKVNSGPTPQPTGAAGRQFTAGTVTGAKLDAALGTQDELSALLEGL